MKSSIQEKTVINKLVHGGQGIGILGDGRKVFVWNALPGEQVMVMLTKSKKDYAEGYATEVVKASPDRITFLERDDINLSVAPWSIMSYGAELEAKRQILEETFAREGVDVSIKDIETCGGLSGYRNKIEFSFWGDDDGLHYAHYLRATHQKIKLEYPYSELIPDQMAVVAEEILRTLNEQKIRAGDLKSLILRTDKKSPAEAKVVAALFVKTKELPKLDIDNCVVVYSNPKSPASVVTEILYTNGDITLSDTLMGNNIIYDVFSFFQVNLPIFELALQRIDYFSGGFPKIDMYSGVGSIGISIGMTDILVESDTSNVEMAKKNAAHLPVKVVHATSETALDYIDGTHSLIVDPPRAGLHANVVEKILEVEPPQVVYLSCNPSTQARDVALLLKKYKIRAAEGYNFFPRTPHIESLVVLELN